MSAGLIGANDIATDRLRRELTSGMKFSITIYRDEDGAYIAECPLIPGCVSQGATEQEAETNLQDAIRECLVVRAEKGMPLIAESREIDISV